MVLNSGRRKSAISDKRKTCLADFVAEMRREEAEEEAEQLKQEEQARRMTSRQIKEAAKQRTEASNMSHERTLRVDQIQPLVDLAYSEDVLAARSAVGLLTTLSINSDNKDILISAGSLKPLLANSTPGAELPGLATVMRHHSPRRSRRKMIVSPLLVNDMAFETSLSRACTIRSGETGAMASVSSCCKWNVHWG